MPVLDNLRASAKGIRRPTQYKYSAIGSRAGLGVRSRPVTGAGPRTERKYPPFGIDSTTRVVKGSEAQNWTIGASPQGLAAPVGDHRMGLYASCFS
jgi:hypothetical protein